MSGNKNRGRSRGGKGGDRNYGRFDDRASNLSGIGLLKSANISHVGKVRTFWISIQNNHCACPFVCRRSVRASVTPFIINKTNSQSVIRSAEGKRRRADYYSVCLSRRLSACLLSVCDRKDLSESVSQTEPVSTYLSIHLFIYLSIHLFIYLSIHLLSSYISMYHC